MPRERVLINCFHYWILFALFNGIELFVFPKNYVPNTLTILVLLTLWTTFELCNLRCHIILSSFRKKQKKKIDGAYENVSQKRGIPYGCGFNQVSCANYFWESLGWLTFSILTWNYTGFLFTIVSTAQMVSWALKKHTNYIKEFGDKYPKGRKAMFPMII